MSLNLDFGSGLAFFHILTELFHLFLTFDEELLQLSLCNLTIFIGISFGEEEINGFVSIERGHHSRTVERALAIELRAGFAVEFRAFSIKLRAGFAIALGTARTFEVFAMMSVMFVMLEFALFAIALRTFFAVALRTFFAVALGTLFAVKFRAGLFRAGFAVALGGVFTGFGFRLFALSLHLLKLLFHFRLEGCYFFLGNFTVFIDVQTIEEMRQTFGFFGKFFLGNDAVFVGVEIHEIKRTAMRTARRGGLFLRRSGGFLSEAGQRKRQGNRECE